VIWIIHHDAYEAHELLIDQHNLPQRQQRREARLNCIEAGTMRT